jgi:hypothetical protein
MVMKSRIVLIIFLLFSTVGWAKYSGGTGEPNNPYRIATPNDLNSIGLDANDWDKHFLMINDIDLSGYSGNQFNTIGMYDTAPFSGVFDGNGYTVNGFNYEDPSGDNVGLFSYVSGDSACIKNLGLLSPNVHGSENVGVLAGRAGEGRIYNCYVSQGTVQGNERVGVLIGLNNGSEIACCYSSGSALAQDNSAGGLIGACGSGVISHCYSTASAESFNAIGGLVGDSGSTSPSYENCYAAGPVIATSGGTGGGLLDAILARIPGVYNCFWDYQTTGQNSSVGGGTKLSTAQMQDANNFQAQGWDFVGPSDGPSDLWAMPDIPGYPVLWLQLEPLPELPVFSGGSGQADDPYIISSASQLRSIGYNPRLMKAHFKLDDDVNLAGEPFNTIARGRPSTEYFAYKGIFDGNNNTISNLSCPLDKNWQRGLFGVVFGEAAKIKNLILTNVDVNAPSWDTIGALACLLRLGSIENCRIENTHVRGKDFVGGLIGVNSQGRVYQCHGRELNISGINAVGGLVCRNWPEGSEIVSCSAEGNVSADEGAAGLVVSNYKALVANSYADVNVSCSVWFAAGFAFDNWGGTITNCYTQGRVSCPSVVGGMIGAVYSDGNTFNCYTSSQVDGNEYTGGFAGVHNSGKYSGCFWDSDVNPDVNSVGIIEDGNDAGIYALSTADLQSLGTFTSAGWDFVGETVNGYRDTWRMCEDGIDSPKLSWEYTEHADLLCPDGVDFIDYSVLADQWKLEKLEQDLNFDGIINFFDWAEYANTWDGNFSALSLFFDYWLERSAGIADITPAGGDDIVDWQDLILFCENWLGQ